MEYKNARVAVLKDRVLAQSPSGPFVGTVVAFENEHLRVVPTFANSASAQYIDPSETLHMDDVQEAADEIKPPARK